MSTPARIFSFVALAGLLLSACGPATGTTVTPGVSPPRFTVASRFTDYYSMRAGAETLGEPISGEIEEGGLIYQYFQYGRLEHNPTAAEGARISLSPLGLEIVTPDPPLPGTPEAGALCYAETGHCVKYAFRPFFEKYGGVYFFGYPITEIRVEDGRLVQYFERAILVWDETLPPGKRVRPAALGIVKCMQVNCGVVDSATDARPGPDVRPGATQIVEPIAAYARRHGGQDVFGVPISEPQTLADGTIEQHYENASFFIDPTAPEGVGLRPWGLDHHPRDPAAAPSFDPSAVYDPATGHNLLNPFRDFYYQHGGLIVFGHPISEMHIKGGILVQYFENVRMEWHSGAPPGLEVRLTSYGRLAWESLAGTPQPTPPTPIHVPQALILHAWADAPILPLGQSQTLFGRVTDETNKPVTGANVAVVIRTSSGDLTYVLPGTGADGQTAVRFALPAWQAGEFVTFEMKATYDHLTSNTVMDSFVQWYGATPTSTPTQ